MLMIFDNNAYVKRGDIIMLQPRDPFFAMIVSPMMMVDRIINDITLTTVDGNIIDLTSMRIVYVNGKELDKYHIDDFYGGEDDGLV